MSEKIYVRKIESWTISSASKPIEVNVERFRTRIGKLSTKRSVE